MSGDTAPIGERVKSDAQQLARYMQARDAQAYGVMINGVQTPSWEDTGEQGQLEYVEDAAATLAAVTALGWVPIERTS
jgi:hypothetical protein